MNRTYTIREAAEISTKSYSALRGMVDRGTLNASGGGRRGHPRRIAHIELQRVGLLKAGEILADSAVQELGLRLADIKKEISRVESRIEARLDRIEALLEGEQASAIASAPEPVEPTLETAA